MDTHRLLPPPYPLTALCLCSLHPQATAPNGYWQLNMNQACYQGLHLSKWTPIGVVTSFFICLGIPFLMFITVWVHRKRLDAPDVQFHFGWLYMRYA